jgi:3-methylcrotonyl-CoA carboxylase alpha subunit
VVSYHFDPLLAKLIVWAPSRRAAIDRMKRALEDFVLLGVRNNIEFLRRVISTDDFGAGKLDTTFLDRHGEVFNVPNEVPVEALLVASTIGLVYDGAVGHRPPPQQKFTDVWDSGSWRNS